VDIAADNLNRGIAFSAARGNSARASQQKLGCLPERWNWISSNHSRRPSTDETHLTDVPYIATQGRNKLSPRRRLGLIRRKSERWSI
jgi:hypothetical protein